MVHHVQTTLVGQQVFLQCGHAQLHHTLGELSYSTLDQVLPFFLLVSPKTLNRLNLLRSQQRHSRLAEKSGGQPFFAKAKVFQVVSLFLDLSKLRVGRTDGLN